MRKITMLALMSALSLSAANAMDQLSLLSLDLDDVKPDQNNLQEQQPNNIRAHAQQPNNIPVQAQQNNNIFVQEQGEEDPYAGMPDLEEIPENDEEKN